MPDRAIIPMLPALSLGFICGIISSALLLSDDGSLVVGVVGAVAVAAIATTTLLGSGGDAGEKAIVGALRAASAVALFVCVYLFILGFLRNGEPLLSLVWLALAIVFAVVLTQLRVRDRGELSADRS